MGGVQTKENEIKSNLKKNEEINYENDPYENYYNNKIIKNNNKSQKEKTKENKEKIDKNNKKEIIFNLNNNPYSDEYKSEKQNLYSNINEIKSEKSSEFKKLMENKKEKKPKKKEKKSSSNSNKKIQTNNNKKENVDLYSDKLDIKSESIYSDNYKPKKNSNNLYFNENNNNLDTNPFNFDEKSESVSSPKSSIDKSLKDPNESSNSYESQKISLNSNESENFNPYD